MDSAGATERAKPHRRAQCHHRHPQCRCWHPAKIHLPTSSAPPLPAAAAPSPPPPRHVLSRSRLPGFPVTSRARLGRPNFRTDIRSRSRPRNTAAAGRDEVALIPYLFPTAIFLENASRDARSMHANVDRR